MTKRKSHAKPTNDAEIKKMIGVLSTELKDLKTEMNKNFEGQNARFTQIDATLTALSKDQKDLKEQSEKFDRRLRALDDYPRCADELLGPRQRGSRGISQHSVSSPVRIRLSPYDG